MGQESRETIEETVERLIEDVGSWPGVTVGAHRFGGTEWRVGPREIGHVHAWGSVTATKNGRDWESSVANATNTFTCISNPHVVMAEFTFQGKEAITKEVTKTGTGAHVFVPKDWIGEEVAIIRLDQD